MFNSKGSMPQFEIYGNSVLDIPEINFGFSKSYLKNDEKNVILNSEIIEPNEDYFVDEIPPELEEYETFQTHLKKD